MHSEVSNIGDGNVWIRDNDGVKVNLIGWDAKYVYIRDDKSGTVFSPWGSPAAAPVKNNKCRFYRHKTEISGECEGLRASLRVFVPKELPIEVQTVTIENTGSKTRKISVFSYAMFQLNGNDKEGKWVDKDNFAVVRPDIKGVFIENRNRLVPTKNFKGFLCTLKDFKGGTGYRDNFLRSEFACGTPKIINGWNCDNKPGYGGDCAGAVQVTLTIPPKSIKRADFFIGQASNISDLRKTIKKLNHTVIDDMCEEQRIEEEKRSNAFKIETGNKNYDSLMNGFVKKQMYYYLINKSGFRDNLQVDYAYSMVDYKTAKNNILRALSSQYSNGTVPHGFRPINRLQYSDKPAWIPMVVAAMVKESGDFSLLNEKVPFYESKEKGSVWEHMIRAVKYLSQDLGKNKLCNQRHADWNDGLEATAAAGERESIMVSQQLCYDLNEIRILAEILDDRKTADWASKLYKIFSDRINKAAWDGDWYVRTICGDGYKIGSKKSKEGRIFINSQTWAVLSGIASPDRAEKCMNSLEKYLGCDLGYMLVHPGFSKYDPRVGRMSNTMPGSNENGGCYCHAAGFKGVADCVLKRPEKAWETFVKTAPDNPKNPISRSRLEPFCFTNAFSNVEYVYGRAANPWSTGTAAWFTILMIEWILGARRDYKGLLIDPCLTKKIPFAKITRNFRGAKYEIDIDNSAGRCTGVRKIILDGKEISGNTITPDSKQNLCHKVKVII
jgi:cellobiose phosphorylase